MRKLAKMAILAIAMLLIMIIMPVAMNNERIALGAAPQQEMTAAECIDPPSGLVSWWPGDGNPYDVVGRNHGTMHDDAGFAPGMVHDAFNFDGVGDWVSAAGEDIDHLQELTIELWVRHDSVLTEEINRYVTLTNAKAVLRHDGVTSVGQMHFYMNLVHWQDTLTADLVLPDEYYDPFTGSIDPLQFSFLTVSGLVPGQSLSLTAEFTNADSDIMCWPDKQPEGTRSYENNILGSQMCTGAHPEVGIVEVPTDEDALVFGCFNYDRAPEGTWHLTIEIADLHHIRVDDALQQGQFYHVAGTYDGSTMVLYLNGQWMDELYCGMNVIPGAGVEIGSGGEAHQGLLDEISIYNRALSSEEILSIYYAGSDGKCKPEDEYFWYSAYYPDTTYVSGVGGYVDNGDPDVLGDEHQYLYFIGDMTGYKVEVTLTDYAEEHPEGDTSPGWIEPHQHPYNPYAPGPVEPRHFEEVSHVYLRFEDKDYTDGARWHSDEFHVDERGIFLGAWPYGIYRWDHNWNDPDFNGEMNYPAVQIAPAPPVPPDPTRITRTETLAYNPDDNVWYAGRRCLGWEYRDVYELVDTDGDESFLDEEWTVAFSYPALDPTNPSEHHDGLEYAGGYLWISDMYSDRIAQWYCDNGVWIEMDVFEYTTAAWVEGMGFGPNDHFWASSLRYEHGLEPHIYEFGGGVLQKEFPSISVNVDIKPGSWPNPINIKSTGVLPVAICGTEELDVMTIDPGTITMRISDAEEEVYPLRWSYEDVATPFVGDPGEGHALDGDGYTDLVLHFDMREVVDTLGLNDHLFETIPLIITGNPYEYGGRIVGTDHVWILAFFDEGKPYSWGHYYSAPYPLFNAPHVIKTGTWLTIGWGLGAYGGSMNDAEQNLRDRVDDGFLELAINGEPLVDPNSGYLWEYMTVVYDEDSGQYLAHVSYRYYLSPKKAGTYEIYWKLDDPIGGLWEATGHVTWVSGQG